jgi:hypothetical protein
MSAGSLTSTMLTLALGFSLLSFSCGTTTHEDHNMACIVRLRLPSYPVFLRQSGIPLSFPVSVLLAPDGSIQSTTYGTIGDDKGDLKPLVVPEMERALKVSQFASSCGGKTVRLEFSFRMDRDPPDGVWFEPPNRFEIGVKPLPVYISAR